ncbi:MAG: formimidoylglutamase [Armatimonadetes bacterium]|nr:formimidoylglutamase [Armatimonadota bacterium]
MKFQVNRELLYSRGEPDDPRLGDVTQTPTVREFEKRDWDIVLIGLPDDRGIAMNRGRPGAAEGPSAIRKWFYRLVPPATDLRIADLGDLVMTDSLEADHAAATEATALGLSRAKRVALLGGGHDWAFSPIAALKQAGRTGFINLDAHLDVRPSAVPHSGTSYWRALEAGVQGEDAVWFGVQKASAAKMHKEYVEAKGGRVFFGDGSKGSDPEALLREAKSLSGRCDAVDLSLDMDVFAMSEAPGVSAPQPGGLEARTVLVLLGELLRSERVRTFGIYETSPPNDVMEMTSRLAARCLWEGCAGLRRTE